MKRIISAIAVVAIVSGALAFKAKPFGGKWCVSANASSTTCVGPITNRIEEPGTANRNKLLTWDGTDASCTGNVCTTPTRLVNQ